MCRTSIDPEVVPAPAAVAIDNARGPLATQCLGWCGCLFNRQHHPYFVLLDGSLGTALVESNKNIVVYRAHCNFAELRLGLSGIGVFICNEWRKS